MGGRISGQSQWQHGSEFTVVLPLDQTNIQPCNANATSC
jgi:signal transduction histidine kinase